MNLLYFVFSIAALAYITRFSLAVYVVVVLASSLPLVIMLGRDALVLLYAAGFMVTMVAQYVGVSLAYPAVMAVSVLGPILYAELRVISLRDILRYIRGREQVMQGLLGLGRAYLAASLILLLLTVFSSGNYHAFIMLDNTTYSYILLSMLATLPYALAFTVVSRRLADQALLALSLLLLPFTASSVILVLRVLGGRPVLRTMMIAVRKQCVNVGRINAVLIPNPSNPLREYEAQQSTMALRIGWQKLPATYYCIPLDTTRPTHVLVVGASGAGKSHLLVKIVDNTVRIHPSLNLIVIDPHGEYVDKLSSAQEFTIVDAAVTAPNVFEILDEDLDLHVERIIDYYRLIAPLGPLQEQLLREVLIDVYTSQEKPSFKSIARQLAILAKTEPRALQLLNYTKLLESLLERKEAIDYDLTRTGHIVIDLSKLPTDWAKRIYVDSLLRVVFNQLVKAGPTSHPRLLLVVDEAHLFARASGARLQPMLVKGVTEMRKYGVIVIAATQYPSQLDKALIANTAFKIALPLYDPTETRSTARMLGATAEIEDKIASTLMNLEQGKAVVSDRDLETPLLVSIT